MATSYVDKNVQFHTRLNPKVWNGTDIDPAVQVHLLQTALQFAKSLKLDPLPLVDVQLTGSLASYNYTPYSDFDLHLIIDKKKLTCDPEVVEQLFDAKKRLWNLNYPVEIHGHTVELYAQDVDQENVTNGCYSLLYNKWVERPVREQPAVNDRDVSARVRSYIRHIDSVIEHGEVDEAKEIKDKINNMRKAGLAAHGQYGVENLTFKVLRNQGYLDKLSEFINHSLIQQLSLD